ncbi:hypothetical protein [Flavobacterium phycosphaerae]|uniref:hypothetical protein n=1 Tax=Flavobacterium phycosphaerae TaxID=2697515 RepID=UPI00138A2D7E|nr:hypothetical protein [Flavobacterium phycosphaerae]
MSYQKITSKMGFREFDSKSYNRDSIVKLNKPLPANIDDESYIVVKFNDTVQYGTFSEILDLVSRKIFDGEIKSKILSDNAEKIFGKYFFKESYLRKHFKFFSALNIRKRALNDYLSKYSGSQLFRVASGNDSRFEIILKSMLSKLTKGY